MNCKLSVKIKKELNLLVKWHQIFDAY